MKQHGYKFLIFTFVLTYLCHGTLAILSRQGIVQLADFWGQMLFILGGSSPTIFAFVIVHQYYSKPERTEFYRALTHFKLPIGWYLFAVLGPILLGVLFLVIAAITSQPLWGEVQSPLLFIPFFFSSILFGGLEEVGWRGILQERLKGKFSPLPLAIIIGVIWGAWHLPALFIAGTGYDLTLFMIQGLVFSLFLTWLFQRTNSIPLAVFFHASINASAAIGLMLTTQTGGYVYGYLMMAFLIGTLLLVKFP